MKAQKRTVKAAGAGATSWDLKVAFVKGVFLTMLASVLLVPADSLADDLPGFRAPLLDQPAPPSDFRSKVGQGPSGPGPSTDDPEIQELARALKYDPGLMYKFVHDYIQFYLSWGDVKGPYMTWMDRSGNGFDQASLMIALLEEAEEHCTEYTVADPNYVVGEIQLSPTQAYEWLDVSGVERTRKVLARAGLYGSVPVDPNDDISLEHVWVKVTIDGNDYEFDPSFKSHTKKNGLSSSSLEQVMEYDEEEFLADANEGATKGGEYVKDVNKGNIADDLTTYSTNLINYIKNNLPDGGLADVIGGRSITPVEDSALPPSSLPYTVVSRDDEFDIDNVPDLYRTSLRIQHCGIDQTFFSSDIYGRRLTLRYTLSNNPQPQIVLDGAVKATGNTTTWGQVYDLTLSVDHPYDVNDFDGTTTLKVTSGGFYQIVNGWGDTGTKILEKHRGALEQYLHDGLADDSEEVLGESFALVGLSWLAQTSRMRSMADEIVSSGTLINHHMLGVTGQYETPYIDVPLGHLGVYKTGDPNGMFLAIASHASAYEHEMIRQLQDCNAVSTVKLLEIANDRTTYDKIFETDSSNWSSIQSQLQAYSQDEKDQVSDYVDEGFAVHLPQYGDLSKDDWTGIGFQAFLSAANCLTAGHVIAPGYKGGCATGDNEPLSPSEVFDRSYVSALGNDGAYRTNSTDLTIGNGGLPFGLSFGRQYSSQRRLEEGPLGLGWTHNFDITAKVRSDSFQVLGEDSPIDAAAHIVTLYVTSDILTDDFELLNNTVVASLCETWLMDQMMDNLVTIKQGAAKLQFVKVPDSSDPNDVYNAPLGRALKLVVEGDGTFLLKDTGGKFSDFDTAGRIAQWSDAHGNVVDFTYTSGKLTQVASKIGGSTVSRSLSFTYSVDHITDVDDSASRSISYTYDVNDNLTEYTNPDGNDITYEYDDVNDGQLTKVFSPVDQVNPFMTTVYDSLGRVKQRIDANDCTWDHYFAYYRAETLGPAQTDPNDPNSPPARFSTVLWANEYGRPIRVLDKLGREATTEYDGHQRVKRVVKPSGASVEYSYDPNHHVIQTFSKVKPNSPPTDPNLLKKNEYDSYENSEGRWFTNRTKYIDPNSSEVLYKYDYDDPNYGSEVGNLMKATYPQVDPPWDTNTPVVQFTYNTYGQLETKTDAEGMVTRFEYYPAADGAGLKKTIVDYGDPNHLNITTELTYDNVGNVATTKDPRGNITQSEYYDSRLLKKTTAPSPFSYVTDYEYYDDGKLKHVKRVIGQETIYLQSITYNAKGQKASVKGPYVDGNDLGVNLTQYDYDALGRLWKVTDAESNVTKTGYYPDGKVWKVVDALGHDTVTNTYDPNGYLQKVEDAKGNVTEYEYNGFGALKKTIYADGSYQTGGYDSIRRPQTRQTRTGEIIRVTYDDLHRVDTKSRPDDNWPICYKRDLTGRVVRIYKFTGTIMTNTYDSAGRLIQVEYSDGKVVSYEYDIAGNRTKLTYPDSSFITYEYDQLNRLTKIRDDASTILAQYTYDERSRRTQVSYANGTTMEYEYDAASRLLDVNSVTDTGHYNYAYTYDKVGNRLSMLFNDSEEHIYQYDDIYQVTDVNYPDGYMAGDTTFNYDDASNRSSVVEGGTTNYVSNDLNQYKSVGSVWYDYDGNGNLTYDASFFYTYDSENRLTEAKKATGGGTGPLTAALETDLSFTTGGDGGDPNWFRTTDDWFGKTTSDPNYHRDSARSGDISASQTSWLKTTVYTEGTIKFYWKVSSKSGDDFLKFYINGSYKDQISGEQDWEPKEYTLSGFGPHTLEWRYVKDGSGDAGEDCGWVDYVEWPGSKETSVGLQDALDAGWHVATTDFFGWCPAAGWGYNDGDCAESGSISHDQSSEMQATVQGAGTVSFYWKVSSEPNHDYLKFYIDGTLKDQISGNVGWQQKQYTLTGSGSHFLLWKYVKDSSGLGGSDCGWVDWLQGPGTAPPEPDSLADALESDLSYTTGGDANWYWAMSGSRDCAKCGEMDEWEETWMQTTVEGEGTVEFDLKVSSAENDYLEFYIDEDRKCQIDGEEDWGHWSFDVTGQGSHTLKWRLVTSDNGGDAWGYVDCVQWSGSPEPVPDPAKWDTITYKYDPGGRRIEKSGNGEAIKYCYDGGHVIAEYDGNDRLLRKYIYGARVDEPVCMIEVVDSNAVYYYHFDGLGSVVALSDSNGDSIQSYEYSVYGQVAAEDPNHPNPYMFTGRRFDIETGLYYYRARCYNPHIGRFMQTDPVGYSAGINWYLYCKNNPLAFADPSGLIDIALYDPDSPQHGSDFQEAADDFGTYELKNEENIEEYGPTINLYQAINSADDVIEILEWLKEVLAREGEEITAVYFYDDSEAVSQQGGVHVTALEFGSEKFKVEENGDLQKFFGDIGDIIGPNATIHLRHNWAASKGSRGGNEDMDWLIKYEKWSGCDVTAVNGVVKYEGREIDGKDYRFARSGLDGDGKVYSAYRFRYPNGRLGVWFTHYFDDGNPDY